MAVIFWTQADGWAGPNTSDGDDSFGAWTGLDKTASADVKVDTVDAPTGLSAAGYTQAWRFRGLDAQDDKAQFRAAVPFDETNFSIQKLAASGVFVLPSLNAGQQYRQVELFRIGDCSVRISKRNSGSPTSSMVLYLSAGSTQGWGDQNTGIELVSYALAGTPLLIEADIDYTLTTGSIALRVYNYADPDSPSLIGSWDSADEELVVADQRDITAIFCGGSVPTSKTGIIEDYYCAEFQIRDRAGSHVKNPYIGYPTGSVWKAEDFADDETLVADADWEHYSGTSGVLQKSSGTLVCNANGSESAVLADGPAIPAAKITVDISNLQAGDSAGVTIARPTSDFDETTGANDTSVSAGEYRVVVEESTALLKIIRSTDSGVLDSASITTGLADTLTVYYKWAGRDCKVCATFGDASVSSDDETIYAMQFGVFMERATTAGSAMSNWTLTWQYPSTHDVYELARFCDGTRANNMLHTAVIQSPKYKQTVIVAQIGSGSEADKSSAIWAWVVPMDGVTSPSDILAPVRLDVGDGSTFRAHNPSGATHDGRAVILWGRDDWDDFNVQDLCGAVHQGGRNFTSTKPLTLGNDAGGTSLGTYRLHLKGHGFQQGDNIVMPGIRTASGGATDHGIVTLTFPLSGTTFGTVTGGTVLDTASRNMGEWAIYPESDSVWWGWVRGATGGTPATVPMVVKSTDLGASWGLQGDDAGETFFPVVQEGSIPIDGSHLGGGEFVLTGPLTPQDPVGAGRRKFITATPISANTVYDLGWQFDRADELVLLWMFNKDGYSTNNNAGYGQVVSGTDGSLMAGYAIRSGVTGELGAQVVLIQIPQSVSGYSTWENTFLGSGGAGRMGLEMDLLL
jgi:hypothetical protein